MKRSGNQKPPIKNNLMGENEKFSPIFVLREEGGVRLIDLQITGDTQWKDIFNYAVHNKAIMNNKDGEQIITDATIKEFQANADDFAKRINNLTEEDAKKLQIRIQKLQQQTNDFLKEYQLAKSVLQKVIDAQIKTISSFKKFMEDSNNVSLNEINAIKKFNAKENQEMAQMSVKIYIRIINLFQDLELFEPNAVIVVYDKNGLREELPYDENVVEGKWKDATCIKNRRKATIVSVGEKCRIAGQGIMQTALDDAKKNNLDVYDGIVSVRNHIQKDFEIFREIVETQAFDITNKTENDITTQVVSKKNKKKRIDKTRNKNLKPGSPIGGLIAEAFEIHYQQYIVQFWQIPSDDNNAHTLGEPGDVKHYIRPGDENGYKSIYSMLQLSSGVKEGYYQPDQGWAQVKTDSATFMAISNLSNMLAEVDNVFKMFNNENKQELANEIVARFNKPDSFEKFKQFTDAFVGEFAKMN